MSAVWFVCGGGGLVWQAMESERKRLEEQERQRREREDDRLRMEIDTHWRAMNSQHVIGRYEK